MTDTDTDTGLTVFGIPASQLPGVLKKWGVSKNVTKGFLEKLRQTLSDPNGPVDFELTLVDPPNAPLTDESRLPESPEDLFAQIRDFYPLKDNKGTRSADGFYQYVWSVVLSNAYGNNLFCDLVVEIILEVSDSYTDANGEGQYVKEFTYSFQSHNIRLGCSDAECAGCGKEWSFGNARTDDLESTLKAFSWDCPDCTISTSDEEVEK